MLSNPPQSGLQARHRLHRRQNSTPTAFESMKTANNLPNLHPFQNEQQQQQQQDSGRPRVSHRRGMSLDTRRQQMHSPTLRQDFQFPVHVLREAQQQRIARPGPNQQQFANLASDENYLVSPHGTPRNQGYDGQCFDGLSGHQNMNVPFDIYSGPGPLNMMRKKNLDSFNDTMEGSQDFELYPTSTMSTPTFMNFNESPNCGPGWISEGETSSTRRGSSRVSNGIMDRVVKFESLGMDGLPRPHTPPQQNRTDYFPLTPMDTPHDRTIKHRGPQRFSEDYDESMEETIKPVRQTTNRRLKTTFDEMRQAAESQHFIPTPPRASTMPMSGAYDTPPLAQPEFLDMNHVNAGMTIQTQFDTISIHTHSMSATPDLSQHTTPITPHFADFSGAFDERSDLRPPDRHHDFSEDESPFIQRASRRGSPHHRRTESIASITSAASIASIDIEQTKTTTGITLDDIHQFIEGPDPRDNKWICTFEDCRKRFGRKENIKSHVQTHLNDRQYKCPTCNKCFVRQHDLKRHAKIHTGVKPYPCECGNSFARHDALTRHKQRGMCIGAFDGIVKKVAKRGRPRKHRPDMDERKDKSARTRKKNKSTSSNSSQSGYSDSSAANSPENLDGDDFNVLDNIMDVSMGGTTMNPRSFQCIGSSSAPMQALGADRAPSAHSPSAASVQSYVSQLSHLSLHPDQVVEAALPSHPNSPAKSSASQFNEPPELSQSSSPPSGNHYFDLEPNARDGSIMMSSAAHNSIIPSLASGLDNDDEDDILLQFTHSGDPNMLMLSSDSKFDEAFDSSVDMFTNNDDLFFGSS